MSAIIQIVARVDGLVPDRPTYVQSVDHSKPPADSVVLTAELMDAHRFADKGAAFEAWRGINQRVPTRKDGKPNRPLTAYTVEIVDVDPPEPPAGG